MSKPHRSCIVGKMKKNALFTVASGNRFALGTNKTSVVHEPIQLQYNILCSPTCHNGNLNSTIDTKISSAKECQ